MNIAERKVRGLSGAAEQEQARWDVAQGARVWALLQEEGRQIIWLERKTGISRRRLWDLRARPHLYFWREEEMEAVAKALGKSRRYLFGGAGQTVRGICLECGKRRRVQPLSAAQAQAQSTASTGS